MTLLRFLSPASFWIPDYICQSAWIEHAPFAFWVCDALRPRSFVELGSHHGYSYFAFCQAIDRLALSTEAHAVDTWQGDEHAGFYDENVFQAVAGHNTKKYAAFSRLIRTTFDDALQYFEDRSVDLLHIDGRHFYSDVKHDFENWRPKLTDNAIVLFHDTSVREREFGVWQFFRELAASHPSFQFFHGHGLGVLAIGEAPAVLAPLFESSDMDADQIRAVYAALGGAVWARAVISERDIQISERDIQISERDIQISERDVQISERDIQISERDSQISERDIQISERDIQIDKISRRISELENSMSWKITLPLRRLAQYKPLLRSVYRRFHLPE